MFACVVAFGVYMVVLHVCCACVVLRVCLHVCSHVCVHACFACLCACLFALVGLRLCVALLVLHVC